MSTAAESDSTNIAHANSNNSDAVTHHENTNIGHANAIDTANITKNATNDTNSTETTSACLTSATVPSSNCKSASNDNNHLSQPNYQSSDDRSLHNDGESLHSQQHTDGGSEPHPKLKRAELPPGMSRNQFKKMQKHQKFLENRPARRKEERQRKKQRNIELRDQGLQPIGRKRLRKDEEIIESDYTVVIDLNFHGMMNDADERKLFKQIKWCYAANRRAECPLKLHMTSLKEEMEERMNRMHHAENWKVHRHTEHFTDVLSKDRLVYLTADSDNIIGDLEKDKVYIIGGLVDHNHHKGLCHRMAQEYGIQHGQLPIGDYIKLASRKVLTVNHVFEILSKWTVVKSWKEAFLSVIPDRKLDGCLDSEGNIIGKPKNDNVDIDEDAEDSDGLNEDDDTEDTANELSNDKAAEDSFKDKLNDGQLDGQLAS